MSVGVGDISNYMDILPPSGQKHACENVIFPKLRMLRMRAVKIHAKLQDG